MIWSDWQRIMQTTARREKFEWRLANGKPFAVIMRVGKYKNADNGSDR